MIDALNILKLSKKSKIPTSQTTSNIMIYVLPFNKIVNRFGQSLESNPNPLTKGEITPDC